MEKAIPQFIKICSSLIKAQKAKITERLRYGGSEEVWLSALLASQLNQVRNYIAINEASYTAWTPMENWRNLRSDISVFVPQKKELFICECKIAPYHSSMVLSNSINDSINRLKEIDQFKDYKIGKLLLIFERYAKIMGDKKRNNLQTLYKGIKSKRLAVDCQFEMEHGGAFAFHAWHVK